MSITSDLATKLAEASAAVQQVEQHGSPVKVSSVSLVALRVSSRGLRIISKDEASAKIEPIAPYLKSGKEKKDQ